MQSDTKQILFQFLCEQQKMIVELCRNDLLLIELILSGPDVEAGLAAAAATVRATLYSVDSLGDTIQQAEATSRQ